MDFMSTHLFNCIYEMKPSIQSRSSTSKLKVRPGFETKRNVSGWRLAKFSSWVSLCIYKVSHILRGMRIFSEIYVLYSGTESNKCIVSTLMNKNGSSLVLSSPRNARDASACAAHTDAERDGYSGWSATGMYESQADAGRSCTTPKFLTWLD